MFVSNFLEFLKRDRNNKFIVSNVGYKHVKDSREVTTPLIMMTWVLY